MTGAEMWTVPDARYGALREAATKQGVTVRRLDDSASPELATVMTGSKMTPVQQEMMHKAMEFKAAVGMSMIMLPDAATIEYALTKRMNEPAGSAPQTILIPLNEQAHGHRAAHRSQQDRRWLHLAWRHRRIGRTRHAAVVAERPARGNRHVPRARVRHQEPRG